MEESLGIVMLTNLLVLMPMVPQLNADTKYDTDVVVQRLQTFTPESEHYFDSTWFAQSVHHNKTWLEKKLNWETSCSYNPNVPIEACGSWPAVARHYYITIRTMPLQIVNYSVYDTQRHEQLRINKVELLRRLLALKRPARVSYELKLHPSVNSLTGHIAPSSASLLLSSSRLRTAEETTAMNLAHPQREAASATAAAITPRLSLSIPMS